MQKKDVLSWRKEMQLFCCRQMGQNNPPDGVRCKNLIIYKLCLKINTYSQEGAAFTQALVGHPLH